MKKNPSGLTKRDRKQNSEERLTQVEPPQQSTSKEDEKEQQKLKAGAKPPKEDVHLLDILAQILVADTFQKLIPAAKTLPQTRKTPFAA